MKKRDLVRLREVLSEVINGYSLSTNRNDLILYCSEDGCCIKHVLFDFLGNNPIEIRYTIDEFLDSYYGSRLIKGDIMFPILIEGALKNYIYSFKGSWKSLNPDNKIRVNREDLYSVPPFIYIGKLEFRYLSFLLRFTKITDEEIAARED